MAVVVMVDIAEVVVGVDMEVDVMAVVAMEVAVMVAVDMEEVVEDTAEVAVDMEVEDIKPSIPSTAFHSCEAYYCTVLFKNTNPHLITILAKKLIKLLCPCLYFCLPFQNSCISKNNPNCSKLPMKLSLTLSMVCGFFSFSTVKKIITQLILKLKPRLSKLLPTLQLYP